MLRPAGTARTPPKPPPQAAPGNPAGAKPLPGNPIPDGPTAGRATATRRDAVAIPRPLWRPALPRAAAQCRRLCPKAVPSFVKPHSLKSPIPQKKRNKTMKPDDTMPIANLPAEELQTEELQEETLDGISGGLSFPSAPNTDPNQVIYVHEGDRP